MAQYDRAEVDRRWQSWGGNNGTKLFMTESTQLLQQATTTVLVGTWRTPSANSKSAHPELHHAHFQRCSARRAIGPCFPEQPPFEASCPHGAAIATVSFLRTTGRSTNDLKRSQALEGTNLTRNWIFFFNLRWKLVTSPRISGAERSGQQLRSRCSGC